MPIECTAASDEAPRALSSEPDHSWSGDVWAGDQIGSLEHTAIDVIPNLNGVGIGNIYSREEFNLEKEISSHTASRNDILKCWDVRDGTGIRPLVNHRAHSLRELKHPRRGP
jgi:hypothetical protein